MTLSFLLISIELPDLQKSAGQGLIPGYENTIDSANSDLATKKYRVAITGFSRYMSLSSQLMYLYIRLIQKKLNSFDYVIIFRYFRQNLTLFSPYFMECIISNMSLSTSSPDNVWKGVLCTCNKDYCNNASATDIHEMFSNDAVKNLRSKKSDLLIQALAVFFFFLSLSRIMSNCDIIHVL